MRATPAVALDEAEIAVAVAEPTSLLLARADAQRALADAHRAARPLGRRGGRLRRALALDERKGNLAAAAQTERQLAEL